MTWSDKISHPAQWGGIETSVLDNGTGRGTRIAWINTGTGLRYKVVIDRAMDIADAFYNRHGLAWLSHSGITYPQPFSNKGVDWLKTFGGGLLVTCGLDHAGGPESDAYGDRGLHGPVSNIPAELESIIQPDPVAGQLNMSITGRVKQFQALGCRLELKRTISGTLGKSLIIIQDEVTNLGNVPTPHMLLYHFNFGWPLIDKGTKILWKGKWFPRDNPEEAKLFTANHDFHTCPDPLEEHKGAGEEVAFIDIEADDGGVCTCGLYNENTGIAVVLRFNKNQLPWLTNWQHWGKGEYVTGLEPGAGLPVGQAKARAKNELIYLSPGEKRLYQLELEVTEDASQIKALLQKINY